MAKAATLLLVLLLAALLRLWRLDSLPPGLYHDEAYNGLDALSLTQGKRFPQFYEGWELYAAEAHGERPAQESRWPVFFEGNYGREPLHIYMMAALIQLLGPSVSAIRLAPALAGIVGVLTTYLAAREVFGPARRRQGTGEAHSLTARILLDPALIAALAVAILFPAVHFSRFGIRAMLFVPLATTAVALFWRGVNRADPAYQGGGRRVPDWAYFTAAGIFLGLGLYSYAAARLFPLVFIVFIPFWFWRDREALRQHWGHVAMMAGAALLTGLPLLLFFARYPYYFVFRIAYVANRGKGAVEGRPWLTWLANVGRVVQGLFVTGETHLRHNLPDRPYMDPIQTALFLAGAVVSIRQRLGLRRAFLWIWLLVMLLPSVLSGDAPHFGRMVGAAPVLAIFIGLGWVGLARLALERTVQPRRNLVLGILGALLLASLVWTIADYFVRYKAHPELPDAFYEADWDMGLTLAELSDEASLYLTPSQEDLATIYYALGTPERLTNFTGSQGIVPAGIPGKPIAYAIRTSERDYLNRLLEVFPEGKVEGGSEAFDLFIVDATSSGSNLNEAASYRWSDIIELTGWSKEVEGDQLAVTLAWKAVASPEKEYTAFVHLLDEEGDIITQVDRPPTGYGTSNWRAGEVIIDRFVLQVPPELDRQEVSLQTGFYETETLTNLGQPFVLGQLAAGGANP